MIAENGCWADYRIAGARVAGRPCLFLDRDGVLIEDTGYPHDASAIAIISETLDVVCAANRAGFVTGIVSNQSGIGRGYFGWEAFSAIQRAIDAALAECGGHLDFILACPHVPEAIRPEHRATDHPWRKPAPGMMLSAASTLRLGLDRSIMIGDRATDLEAAAAASIPHRGLLGGRDDAGPDETGLGISRRSLLAWFASVSV